MCSVATNLVTSQEFYPLRCATTLSYFGRTRTCYVATHFIPLSSTAKSSATRGYVVVPEIFGQKAEPANRNEERTRKKLSFVPSSGFEQCRTYTNVNMNFSIIFISCLCFFRFNAFLSSFFFWRIPLIFCLCLFLLCRCGNVHFDIHFYWIRPARCLGESWKRRVLLKDKGRKGFFFPARIGVSSSLN